MIKELYMEVRTCGRLLSMSACRSPPIFLTDPMHVDPTSQNIGIAAPQIDQFSELDIVEHFVVHQEMQPVIAIDPTFRMDTVPP